MGEIKRYNKGHCEYNVCGMHEHTDGNWVSFEDHQQSLAEAKKEGAREILNKALRFECKEIDCSNCLEENDIVCAMNGIVRTYGVDEVIQKLEA